MGAPGRGGLKVNFGEKIISSGMYVIVISMFVYLVASGMAIVSHGDYMHECPNCVTAQIAER